MAQLPPDPLPHRSVLELLGSRHATVPKLLLPDSGSEHGASPILAGGTPPHGLANQGPPKYRILGEIARGGMGQILKGHDGDLGRDLAIKVLDPELAKNPAVVSRFVEEAQIGGQLQHPGIVPVYELGLAPDGTPYFTMKLIKGRTLSALLAQRRSTADNRIRLLQIFESVCQTLAYAHSKGVLHRDVKPANIMVGAFGEVQVVDWGLAKVLHRGGVADERRARHSVYTIIETVRSGPGSSGSDSVIGSVMGTPAYMAPEQAQGEVEQLDERADVFALGATLCEILTGRPPYEEAAGAPVLVQAAHARLEPARQRLAACGADPLLVQICTECLLPAREARPRDAEAVARAVHEYLTSVDQRARDAEVAASAAKVKADEQRRRLRLTVALAGAIVGMLLLGGGSFWWVHSEREQRTAKVRAAVEAAFAESLALGQEGRPEDALAAARRSVALVATGDIDPALRERAAAFVQQAEAVVATAAQEQAALEQDEALRQQLVDLRLRQIDTIGDRDKEAALHAQFVLAFRDYGVDLDAAELLPALERLRARHIAEPVALALDDLGRLRRNLFGQRAEQFQRVAALAMDLDPEPERLRLRRAILDDDLPTLLAFAEPEQLGTLPPGSVWVLSATLWDRHPEQRRLVYRMYDQALYLHPDDYVLQAIGATLYRLAGRHDAALACRRAAFALQPANVQARYDLGDGLFFAGRLVDAQGVFRACIAKAPRHAAAHNGLGWALQMLGDFEGAVTSFRRAAELESNEMFRADLLAARYLAGTASRDDVRRGLAAASTANTALDFALALADHPDPARRDPRWAIEIVRDPSFGDDFPKGGALLECLARMHLGEWPAAEAALALYDVHSDLALLTPLCLPFVRAVLHAHLGRRDAARECLQRGLDGWRELVGNDDEGWARSDVARWRAAAERALTD
jgi:serine/threonine-protein kinase